MAGDVRPKPDTTDYTLTVEEVAELFAEAGVPRNPRSIRRFCQNGELDCITIETPTSARYLISKISAEKLITQKQQAMKFGESRTSPAMSGHDRSELDVSGHDQSAQLQSPPERESEERADPGVIKRLEDELVNLRIDNRAKEQVITMLRDERREMLEQIQSANYRLGSAETRLAQIEAPKADVNIGDAEDRERIEAIIVAPSEPENVPTPVVSDPPQPEPRSFFGRLLR